MPDLRVLTLMKKHGMIFIPESIIKYQYQKTAKAFPNTCIFGGFIICETLGKGLEKSILSLDVFSRFKPKTVHKYLVHMANEKVILWAPTDHYNQFEIGFNAERFGPLFPNYEEALNILNMKGLL